MTIRVCVTVTLTFVVQKCWKIWNFVLRWPTLSATTWMNWSLSTWRHHSFLSQRLKGRVTIWYHLVSIKGIFMLFLKVHKSLSNCWWMLVLTVTTKSSNVSVMRTCVETASLSSLRSTWKRLSLLSKKSKISQKAWLRASWKKLKASKWRFHSLVWNTMTLWLFMVLISLTLVLICCFRTWQKWSKV